MPQSRNQHSPAAGGQRSAALDGEYGDQTHAHEGGGAAGKPLALMSKTSRSPHGPVKGTGKKPFDDIQSLCERTLFFTPLFILVHARAR